MNILIAYGHDELATGLYLERSLRRRHNVLYCGPPSLERPEGYPFLVDLQDVLKATGFKPDFYLYIESGPPCFPLGLEKLDCPTACLMIDMFAISDAEAKSHVLKAFDYAFVLQKVDAEKVRRWDNVEAVWLPAGYEPEIHPDYHLPRTLDIGFIGSAGRLHEERWQVLRRLASTYKMNELGKRVSHEEMARIYSQSKLAVNFCPPWCDDYLTMRLFEAMGCGAMMLYPRVGNGLPDIFRDGEHLVTYSGSDDLMQKVAYYLQHDDERVRIAAAGQAQVLAHHTYDRRVEQVLHHVFEVHHGERRSPLRGASEEAVRAAIRPFVALLIGRSVLHQLTTMRSRLGLDWRLLPRAVRSVYRAVVVPRKKR